MPNFQHGQSVPVFAVGAPASSTRPHTKFPSASSRMSKAGTAGPSHWSEYWREFGPKDGPHERCYVPADARAAVDRHWGGFAARLQRGAAVLDIGCGAGIVGRTLLSHRPDLQVSGIDFANVPVPNIRNLTIHPWISMEALPFEAQCLDAAISLFGIEYGDIGKTATQLQRVLKPGASLSFLVHHVESEIVREGATRRRALRELLSAKVRTAFLSGSVAELDRQLDRLANQFPGEPSLKLFSKCLRHDVTRRRPERQQGWQNLLNGLGTELLLLTQLERSAKSPVEMGIWLAPLLAGMANVDVSVLRRASGEPVAWKVGGNR